MKNKDIGSLIESQLNALAQQIIDKKSTSDEIAHAKIGFYLTLRRTLDAKPTPADIGLLDAINDTLQALGIIDQNRTFLASMQG